MEPLTAPTGKAPPIVTLTTDFGHRTGYAGMLHGAIYQRCPGARVIDLTHAITPGRVREAAFVLGQAYQHFPPGTIHVGVVDPGVGTTRRALVLDVPGVGRFVGPDNGLFSYVLDARRQSTVAREIANRAYMADTVTHTYHGRDLFAPVAGCLAGGAPLAGVGPELALAELLVLPRLLPDWEVSSRGTRMLRGEAAHIDSFGNVISNLTRARFDGLDAATVARVQIRAAGQVVTGIARTYGDQPPGTPIALFGSGGFLELARVNGRAAGDVAEGDALLGTAVIVELLPDRACR